MEGWRKRRVAIEETAKRMLGYLEDSEDLKVGISELKEQLETPEEEGRSIMQTKHARNEKGQKMCIASLARWNTQLKSPVELER